MIKSTLTAALLATLLAGPAFADDDDDRRRGDGRDDRYDRRYDDRDHDRHDRRRHDRRDDDRRHGHDWRDDRRWHRDRDWRHVPPAHYRLSFGYRSGYELAWRDWQRYGRHDRRWRRNSYRSDFGFRIGYDAGWRDAARYYGRGYRPRYWERDPHGSWYFGFRIDG